MQEDKHNRRKKQLPHNTIFVQYTLGYIRSYVFWFVVHFDHIRIDKRWTEADQSDAIIYSIRVKLNKIAKIDESLFYIGSAVLQKFKADIAH